MKSTNVNSNGQNGPKNNTGFTSTTPQPVPVSELIKQAKEQNPDAKEPTTYATAAPPADQPQEPLAAPQVEQTAPAQESETTITALIPTRSRADEIAFQVEKSRKLQLINTQLQNLKGKFEELKGFSYEVDKDDNYRYGRLVIFDDNNREFQCKNHGLAALVVEQLKTLFAQKIDEKETELLAVSRS